MPKGRRHGRAEPGLSDRQVSGAGGSVGQTAPPDPLTHLSSGPADSITARRGGSRVCLKTDGFGYGKLGRGNGGAKPTFSDGQERDL
jgi:hypothetical protein